MKKSTKGKSGLSPFEIQAARLNKLEYQRLQNHKNSIDDESKIYVAHFERQIHGIRQHYANVVQVVKPNPAYQLWKQAHANEIAQDQNRNFTESVKHQQKVPSEPVRPLLLLFDNKVEKPVEPIIDFSEMFLRPKTSPVKQHFADQQRKNTSSTMSNKRPMGGRQSAGSFLPSVESSRPRKLNQSKLLSTTNTTNASNLDALYRITLQNLSAYKPVDRRQIEKRKLLDGEFAAQHRALKGTVRSAGLVK